MDGGTYSLRTRDQRYAYSGEVNEKEEPCGHGTAKASGNTESGLKTETTYEGTFLNSELHGIGMSLSMRPYIYFIVKCTVKDKICKFTTQSVQKLETVNLMVNNNNLRQGTQP